MPPEPLQPPQQYYKFEDTRPEATPNSNFSGWYGELITRKLIKAAIDRGIDPNLVLGMAMRETNMGTRGEPGEPFERIQANPLRYLRDVHEKKVYNIVDDQEQWVPKGPKGKGSAEFWKWFKGDTSFIGKALDYMQYRTNLPGKNLQNYQGTGDHAYNDPNTHVVKGYPAKVAAMKKIFENMPEIRKMIEEDLYNRKPRPEEMPLEIPLGPGAL